MTAHPYADGATPELGTAPAPLLIDAKAACSLLCMGERRLWVLTNCKAIPSRKIGKSVRYSPSELKAWVDCGCPTEAGAGDRVRRKGAA